jgi:hypothetical protein
MEKFFMLSNLCLFNNKSATYLHPTTGALSSLDLAFYNPTLYLITLGQYSWICVEATTTPQWMLNLSLKQLMTANVCGSLEQIGIHSKTFATVS